MKSLANKHERSLETNTRQHNRRLCTLCSARYSVQGLWTPKKVQINSNILDLQTGEPSAKRKVVVGFYALSHLRLSFLPRCVHPYFIRSPLVFSELQVPCSPSRVWSQLFRRRKSREFGAISRLSSRQTSSGVKGALVPLLKKLLNFLVAALGN